MTTVSQVMTRGARTLSPTDSVMKAAQLMDELNVGVIPVCDGDKLVGVVTDRDIVVRGVARSLDGSTKLSDVMSGHVRCATEDQAIDDVLATMSQAQIRRMPVVDGKQRLVGIVTIGDIAAKDRGDDVGVAESLAGISSPAAPDRKA
jgi:CBS domain-containing protein